MEYLYFLSAPLLLVSGLPQIVRLLKRKTSEDVSMTTYILTWIAVVLLFFNALQNGNASLALANGISMVTVGINLFLIIKYRA